MTSASRSDGPALSLWNLIQTYKRFEEQKAVEPVWIRQIREARAVMIRTTLLVGRDEIGIIDPNLTPTTEWDATCGVFARFEPPKMDLVVMCHPINERRVHDLIIAIRFPL